MKRKDQNRRNGDDNVAGTSGLQGLEVKLRPSRIPKSSTSPNFSKLLRGSRALKGSLVRSWNEATSPKKTSEPKKQKEKATQQQQQQLEMRKRKLVHDEPEKAKKPFLMASERPSQIPRAKATPKTPDHQKITQKEEWLNTFQSWSDSDQKSVLLQLIESSHPNIVRYMREVIEPRFQRDFISLLPRELALMVLSNLTPRDLMNCSQTCRTWRHLADDNLLWSRKCKAEGINECPEPIVHKYKRRLEQKVDMSSSISGTNEHAPWKESYLRKKQIIMQWEKGIIKPKELIGHDDHVVTCLQFDGDKIVSGSDDNTLKVWNAATGTCSATLQGHTGGVWCLEMNSEIIVSGSTDRTLRVWDAATGECRNTFYGHSSTVRCMAMSGDYVVSGSRDNTLRLWNVQTGECVDVLLGHLAAVRCVCFDGRKIVSGSYDNTVKIWDPYREGRSKLLFTLQGHQQRVYSLQFDGKTVVSGSLDTNIMVWCASTGRLLHTLMGHQSLTSGMELRNNILVSGNADSTVKMWDIRTGKLIRTLDDRQSKHESAVTSLQYSGKFIVTSSDDGTVKLWNADSGKHIRDLVSLDSRRNGGVVWRIKASETKLVCAVGSRNGTEDTKLLVLDFGEILVDNTKPDAVAEVFEGDLVQLNAHASHNSLGHVNPT